LDGIPLAIELAAARVKVLAVEQIAMRLDDRFRLLTGGGRTVLPRHQTLRATMDWSYGLLSENERALLRRLSVFAGGWTLEAAGAVYARDDLGPTDALNLLTQLVDKSLVAVEVRGGEARYRLLETVRQYGRDRLIESAEVADAHRLHLRWYMELGEQAEPKLRGPEQRAWLERLETEHDNIRAALEWSGTEVGGAEPGLRLAGSLYWFWLMHGHVNEGRQWLEKALSNAAHTSGPARAKGLMGAGSLARRQGDYKGAEGSLQASLVLFRESGDQWGIGFSLHHLGHVAEESDDYGKATVRFEDSIAAFRKAGDKWGVAGGLNCLGEAMHHRGDYRGATPLLRESLTLYREIGDNWSSAYPVRILGTIAAYEGDYQTATVLLEDSFAIERETGDKYGMAQSRSTLGNVAFHQGHHERAMTLFKESLVLRRELGNKVGVAECMERLGGVAGEGGHPGRAGRLFGAAEALRESIGAPVPPVDRADYERNVAAARAGLSESAFASAWAEGRAMTVEQAVEYALTEESG
jgi:tetratricopeptide (TPR) repeat protein